MDTQEEPLSGVTIIVKGTTRGVSTDVDGSYIFQNIPENAILVYSFVGMRTQEISVRNKTIINVIMEEETVGLDEVIAVGYGS